MSGWGINGNIERAFLALAKLFPKSDTARISALGMVCTTPVFLAIVIRMGTLTPSSSTILLWAFLTWVVSIVALAVIQVVTVPGRANKPKMRKKRSALSQ
jgi:hypothetical protein